jgi:Concanavalin A-like lectin/glucanases superfamily
MLAAGALAAGLAVPATASAGVLDSVSGWWPMYEGSGQTVHDLSGHGNNGTLGSTPAADENDPTWIKGFLFGSALRFDGNDFVRIPNAPQLNSTNLTVSTWVRGSASPGTYRYVIGKGGRDCESSSYGLFTSTNGGLNFYVTDTSGTYRTSGLVAPEAIWNGKWHHVAGTWDGTTAKLFVDGKLAAGATSAPATINYNLPSSDASIGGYLGSCDLFYTGDVDDVAIFSQALPIDKYWSALSLLFPKPLR